MIEAIIWMAVGGLAVIVGLVCYAAYVGLMTSDEQYRRDIKHRNHHKWQG
jgi:uncharacterized membrane protein